MFEAYFRFQYVMDKRFPNARGTHRNSKAGTQSKAYVLEAKRTTQDSSEKNCRQCPQGGAEMATV